MSYLALYRKYRPTTFDEMSGQKEIVRVIKNAIENNKVSHAYLFAGPRGTGKTTTAKIIAKMVNCEHLENGKICGNCDSCMLKDNNDIIEIDAASNNGVDEIREIRDKVNLVPSKCKYKIYIIDEVHMLTTQAFNALLKTLEEPPRHIIFILATTEYYKIPLTILSRCQKFQFNKLSLNEMVDRLRFIALSENINISDEALYEIAKIADGGMRDAINLLDQLISYKVNDIEVSDVYNVCEIISTEEIVQFLIYIKNKESNKIIEVVDKINDKGYNLNKFLEEIIYFLKDTLIYKYSKNTSSKQNIDKIKVVGNLYNEFEISNLIVNINDILNKLKTTNYPSIILVVELLKIVTKNNNINDTNVAILEGDSNNEVKLDEYENKNDIIKSDENINNNVVKTFIPSNGLSNEIINIRINNTFATANKTNLNNIKENWKKISDYLIDEEYGTIAGILNDTLPVVAGEEYLILSSKYDSISDRINEDIAIVEKLINKVFDKKYLVLALSDEKWNIEKQKYMDNRKKGIVYNILKEKIAPQKNKQDQIINELINIVGADIIEYN